MREDTAHAAQKIKLDVGDKILCIAKSHLLSVEGSYFYAMLASDNWKPDSDGAYFIDRDPKNFDRVLNYLRTGKLSTAGLRSEQMRMLHYLQLNPEMCGRGLRLYEDNRVVVSNKSEQCVRSGAPCERFSVQINASGNVPDVSVGFARAAGFTPNEGMDDTMGRLLNADDGSLYSEAGESNYKIGQVREDAIVTCILDREKSKINFEVDGKSFGVACANIPDDEVYATVCFAGVNI